MAHPADFSFKIVDSKEELKDAPLIDENGFDRFYLEPFPCRLSELLKSRECVTVVEELISEIPRRQARGLIPIHSRFFNDFFAVKNS